MLSLTKKNLVVLRRMVDNYRNLPDERKYNSVFELMMDFIMWKLDSEKRTEEMFERWMQFHRANRIDEFRCREPFVWLHRFCNQVSPSYRKDQFFLSMD